MVNVLAGVDGNIPLNVATARAFGNGALGGGAIYPTRRGEIGANTKPLRVARPSMGRPLKPTENGPTMNSAVAGTALANALDEPDTMDPFYTDSSLNSLKPMAEFKAAFQSIPQTAYL